MIELSLKWFIFIYYFLLIKKYISELKNNLICDGVKNEKGCGPDVECLMLKVSDANNGNMWFYGDVLRDQRSKFVFPWMVVGKFVFPWMVVGNVFIATIQFDTFKFGISNSIFYSC